MIKKITILATILCIGSLCSCKDELIGKGPVLGLNPKHLKFSNRGDTAIVTAQRGNFRIGYTFEAKYISPTEDTLYDGWIKVITLPEEKKVKVIVYDNDTEYGRYYIADIDGLRNGESINIFQSAKDKR